MVAHVNLTGANLHEPKGADTANAGEVYVADGAGSGSWTARSSGITNYNRVTVSHKLSDISTAHSEWVPMPFSGEIIAIYTALGGAIATANAGISFEIAGTPVTDGNITVTFSGSAAGDADSASPSAANTVAAGGVVEVITDGASDNAVDLNIVFVIDVSA